MAESETKRAKVDRRASLVVLFMLLGVALVLRWRYIREISLFVDEFVTAWAARNVMARGVPSFPSGNIYPHGFVFTYLEVPFVAFGRFDETLARIPGLLVSLAGLPVVYWVGRRLLSEQAGLVAAAAMAVDPDFIVWGGRARMYGLLQLLTLLVLYLFHKGMVDDRPRYRYAAMSLLVVSVFTHAEAALLLPVLALAALVAWPWRRIVRWSVVLPFAIGVVGVVAFFLLARFGQPGHLETLEQEGRSYLSLSGDLLRGWQAFAPVLLRYHRLPFAFLTAMGLYSLFRPRFDRRSSMTYLYVVLITFALLVILPAGAFWQRERYLFLILPLLFLISGQVLVRLMGRLPLPSLARGWGVALLPLLVTLFVGLTGTREAYAQEWGYDLAFRYLRDRWNPDEGDLIVTPMSTASMLYLGRNDFFAIQQGYEEYIVSRPGDHLPADLWTATPIITSTAEFVQILTDAPRVWFVTDGWRFQTRYNTDFIVTVLNHMELEFNERGAMVFRADGYEPLPEPPVQHDRRVDFGDQIALTGFDLSSVGLGPGDTLGIRLRWQSLDGARPAYTVFLHLVRPDGRGVAGVDELLLGGFYQPDLWPPSQVVPDRHQVALPFSLEPGRYRLDLGLYLPGEPDEKLSAGGSERIPLAMIPVGETQQARLPSTAVAVDVDYGPIRLLGYELEHAQRDTPYALDLTLYWQATAPVDRDYSVFVHLVDQEGDLVTQDDAPPGDPFFGTTTWLPGVIVPDRHALSLPAGSPLGDYLLRVGLYHPSSEDRLPATGPSGEPLGDSLQIDPVRVGSSSP